MEKEVFDFLIPALLGGTVSLVATHFRNLSVAQRFKDALSDIERHIEASTASLEELQTDQPKYFLVARIRYCRFLEDVKDLQEGWWIRRSARRSHRKFLLAVRNSDIFVDEAASRIDNMNEVEIRQCLEEVKVNLGFLKKAVQDFKQI